MTDASGSGTATNAWVLNFGLDAVSVDASSDTDWTLGDPTLALQTSASATHRQRRYRSNTTESSLSVERD